MTQTLFRATLALLKLNEKVILRAQSVESLMMFIKSIASSAHDSSAFMAACYDPRWMSSFTNARIKVGLVAACMGRVEVER
jgi:hypothetical protein